MPSTVPAGQSQNADPGTGDPRVGPNQTVKTVPGGAKSECHSQCRTSSIPGSTSPWCNASSGTPTSRRRPATTAGASRRRRRRRSLCTYRSSDKELRTDSVDAALHSCSTHLVRWLGELRASRAFADTQRVDLFNDPPWETSWRPLRVMPMEARRPSWWTTAKSVVASNPLVKRGRHSRRRGSPSHAKSTPTCDHPSRGWTPSPC